MKTKLNFLVVLTLLAILAGASASSASAQAAITIGPDTLAAAEYYTQYSQQFTASSGTEPYTFSLVGGTLPLGLTLSSSGLLSGLPASTPGIYPLTILAVDASGGYATRSYNLELGKGTPIVLAHGQNFIYWGHPFMVWAEVKKEFSPGAFMLLNGTVAFSIDGVLVPGCEAVQANSGAYECANVTMSLGLGAHTVTAGYTPDVWNEPNFYPASGSGTFTVQPGAYTVFGQLFRDLDRDGVYDYDESSLGRSLTVKLDQDCNDTVDYSLVTDSYYSSYYFYNIPGGHCYRMTADAEPGWEQTTQPADFWLSGAYSVHIGFYYPNITFDPYQLPSGSRGAEYYQVLAASGGAAPYTYTLTYGTLPDGLTLSETGVLSGTPTQAGIFYVEFQAQDSDGAAGTRAYRLEIHADADFTFTSSANPSTPGEAVTFTLTAAGVAYHYYEGLIPPNGYVTFFADGNPIEGCSDVDVNYSAGQYGDYPATCTTDALSAGSHEITAAFTDYPRIFNDATLTLTQQVGQSVTYTISGSIFWDYNRNGLWDEGDHVFSPSGRVDLDQGCDATVDDNTLLADSQYAFGGLSGGECYRITVEIDELGMKQTTQLADITLTGNTQIDIGFNYPLITMTPPPGTEAIPAELPSPIVGEAYYQEFTVSGGDAPYAYELVTSYLPDGLTLSETGGVLVLSGTPAKGGLYGFGVNVSDTNGAPLLDADGYPAPAYYSFVMKTDPVFTFTSSASTSAPGEAVTFTVSATGDAVILNSPMPPVGWVTFSAGGTPIEGCSDLLLNVGDSGPEYNPVTCTTAALEAGSHQITATYTDAIEAMLGYQVYNPPSLAPLTQVVGEPLNTAPTANPGGPYLGAINAAIPFDGSGSSDPDGDPLTYAWSFGDGSTSPEAAPSHPYSAAGIYNACLTVNDGTLDSPQVCTLAVVFDPSAGFVTGGGWIDSQPGAYLADPSLSGKATFGFVSKYQKGASVPEGTTAFQFDVGDFEFYSSAYDWLVVSKDQLTAQFKGSGTVNGALAPNGSAYKFMLWAGDGSPDTFRIQIWWESDGIENVVYDNGFNQAIGAGNIVVHTGK